MLGSVEWTRTRLAALVLFGTITALLMVLVVVLLP